MLLEERELDLESFLLQRQNVIPETSSQGIREHHIKYAWLPNKFNRLVLGVDLAVSANADSDATAFVMLGITDDSIYICDAREERIQGNMKKIDIIVDMWEARKGMCNNALIVAVDKNKYSIALEGDLKDYIDSSSDDFKNTQIEPVPSAGRGDKLDRITSHSSLFENGKIFFNKVADFLPRIATEITDYNPLDSNDLMDSTEVGLFIARQYLISELSVVK
jgi:phage terminase large subunit-like protein